MGNHRQHIRKSGVDRITRKCTCNDWKEFASKLDGAITIAYVHGCWDNEFTAFVFCPWCGKKLTEVVKP